MVHDGQALARASRPSVMPPEHQIYADDLDLVHEAADPAASDIDRVIHEEVAFECRSDAQFVSGGVKVEDDIEVACHPRLGIDRECPCPCHIERDLEASETIEDVALDVHSRRMRRKSEV